MKDRLMHLIGEDKKKLLLLASLILVVIFLLMTGSVMSREEKSAATENGAGAEKGFDGESIERTLGKVLAEIDGAGSVSVLISWNDDGEELYAYNEETVSRGGEKGETEMTSRSELVSAGKEDHPVVKKKLRPEADGVLIVAEGADDEQVRFRLLTAAATYLDIGTNRVEVTAGR